MKKILIFLFAFYSIFVFSAETAEISATRKQLAEQLLEKLDLKKKIQESFAQIEELQSQIVDKIMENAPDSAETRKLREQINATNKKELAWDNMKVELVKIYATAYSEVELKELNSFFSSATGKKFIAKTPELQLQFINILRDRIKNTTAKTRSMAVDFMKQQMLAGKTKMPKSLQEQVQPQAASEKKAPVAKQ